MPWKSMDVGDQVISLELIGEVPAGEDLRPRQGRVRSLKKGLSPLCFAGKSRCPENAAAK